MSIPLRRFSDLSLEMPTTRAQSSFMAMQVNRDSSPYEDEDLEDESADDDTAESPTIRGPSRLKYDVRRLSPNTKSRVRHAFRGQFSIDHCRHHALNSPDDYYAFQVAETRPYWVRLGRSSGRYRIPECFCRATTALEALSSNEYEQLMNALHRIQNSASASRLRRVYDFVQENGMLDINSSSACRHVYWLFDQIAAHTLQDQDETHLYSLSRDGDVVEAGPAFEQISRIGLENLAREKNWTFREKASDTPVFTSATDRIEETRDIIAALCPSARSDILDQLPVTLVVADVLVPDDIEATLARALLVSNDCFSFFQTAVPLNHRATARFRRLGKEAKNSLTLLDEYIASASQRGTIPTHDVSMTAQALKDIVASIEAEYEARSHAVGPAARSVAANVLVYILNAVVNRDKDVYAGLRRPRIPIPQRAIERNLYQLLIGSASRHEGSFVLDVLETLPDGATDLVDDLDGIYTRIYNQGAQEGYLNKLRRIVDQLRGREYRETAAGSSSKRQSEAPEGRSGKRQMK